MRHLYKTTLLGSLLALATSCDNFERNIDIDLPEVERELVIECYLRPGEPFRVLLTETKGYFDELDDCPTVRGAMVIIEHNGIADTLQEAPYLGTCTLTNPNFIPYFDDARTRFYNYGSSRICPLDFDHDFKIHVFDTANNRYATATTRMLPKVPIASFTYNWNNDTTKAYYLLEVKDSAATVDFYRFIVQKDYVYKPDSLTGGLLNVANDAEGSATIDDARFYNGQTIPFGSSYNYELDDTLIATVYHIEQAYHDYLETIRDSEQANGNPFAQPPTIVDNVTGGRGIFTFLIYDRDTIIIQR